MIAAGRYQARAIEAALGESGNHNPQVAVHFKLEGVDETITWYGSFSENLGSGKKTPLERTIESLRLCGWVGDDLSNLQGVTDNDVSLTIEHDSYDGNVRAKVKWINPPGGLALKAPLSADRAKAFAASMRGKVIAASKDIVVPKKDSNDDDLVF